MVDFQRKWRTKREVFVDMLKPLLTTGWYSTTLCCDWLEEHSGRKSIPTPKELGTCIQRHPNIIKRKLRVNEWKWVE